MTNQHSYSRLEQALLPAYRAQVAAAATVAEVQQAFVRTACELLAQAAGEDLRIRHEDVRWAPAATPAWALADELLAQPVLRTVWAGSDLAAILSRLAEPAVHRHVHLAKHPEKTNSAHYIAH